MDPTFFLMRKSGAKMQTPPAEPKEFHDFYQNIQKYTKIHQNTPKTHQKQVRSEIGNNWFVSFDDDDNAIDALEHIRTQTFKGEPVKV